MEANQGSEKKVTESALEKEAKAIAESQGWIYLSTDDSRGFKSLTFYPTGGSLLSRLFINLNDEGVIEWKAYGREDNEPRDRGVDLNEIPLTKYYLCK